MNKLVVVSVLASVACGCAQFKAPSWLSGWTGPKWTEPFAGEGTLEEKADFEPGVWHWEGDGVITAEKDSAIWLKGDEYENFILDFDYKLDPEANSGVVIYCSDRNDWIPNSIEVQLLDDFGEKWKNDPSRLKNASLYGHVGPAVSAVKAAGAWNHMSIIAQGKRIEVWCNGVKQVDEDISKYKDAKTNPDGTPIQPWLSKPLDSLPTKGAIGFQGKHGGARPYFRNIRVRGL